MKILNLAVLPLALIIALVSCGSKDGNNGYPPENLSDTAKVAFMIDKAQPDSVARYICCTFLGWNKGVSLKSMEDAVVYAYGRYKGNDLVTFSEEFDNFANSLPLPQRMIILSHAASSDADGLGYRLGLEYAAEIQAKRMHLKDVDAQLSALRKACGTDTLTYLRVLKGISVAIQQPEYSNLPPEVVSKYGVAPELPHHIIVEENADTDRKTAKKKKDDKVEKEKDADKPKEAEKDKDEDKEK